MINRVVQGAVLSAGLVMGLASCHSSADKTIVRELEWKPCEAAIGNFVKATGGTDATIRRMSCATVDVPVDYSDPDGETISLAISKLTPVKPARISVMINPGGPGLSGRQFVGVPQYSQVLGDDIEFIGFDVRGIGKSASKTCADIGGLEPPDETYGRTLFNSYAHMIADANQRCVKADPMFYKQWTIENVARDMDRIRQALKQERTNYFGVSWGTGLGMTYRQLFSDHSGVMVLESMSFLGDDNNKAQRDLIAAQSKAPDSNSDAVTDGEETADDGLTPFNALPRREQEDPESPEMPVLLNYTARTALTCNALGDVGNSQAQWKQHRRLSQEFKRPVDQRVAFPGNSEIAGVSFCSGWPTPGKELKMSPLKSDSTVLIIGHRSETVTPYIWAVRAAKVTGTHFLTINDSRHAEAMQTSCASGIAEFFKTQKIAKDTCTPQKMA